MEDDIIQPLYTVYTRRWLVISLAAILNISSATLWLSYAPVANTAANYYSVDENWINWFSLVFLISTVFTGGFSVWLTDKKGIRIALLLGAWLNAAGALIRLLDRFTISYSMALVGQVIASLGQPFLYCLSTKLSEVWFPQHQRALATTIIVMALPVGQLLATGLTPLFVNPSTTCGIPCMNIVWFVPAVILAALTTYCIRTSKPEQPPSDTATVTMDYPYLVGLKMLLTSRSFVILMLATGSILGLSALFLSCMEEMLCAKGYNNEFSGYSSIVFILSGLFGAFLSSIWVDKTQTFIRQIKIAISLMTLSFCFFIMVTRYNNVRYLVLISSGLVGFFGFAGLPVGLKLAAEYCFQIIPEATSTGLIVICGQLQGLLFIILHESLGSTLSESFRKTEKCTVLTAKYGSRLLEPLDDTTPILVICGFIIFCGTLFVSFFESDKNRFLKAKKDSPISIIFGQDEIDSSTNQNNRSIVPTSIYS